MFEALSLEALQLYWWAIVSLLGGLFVFMMFVQGGQTLIFSVPKSEIEKSMIINSLGRKWELGFTTLVLFGGACFAAFPLFYATSFGGAYWVWMAILFCFIIQAVSYEYRKKPDNFLGQRTYEVFLFINGSLGVFLLGVAISTFFSGSEFLLSENNFVEWQNPLRGLEALANPFNYLLGFSLFFLARITGGMYLINTIEHKELQKRLRKSVVFNTIPFLVFFLGFLGWILTKDGFGIVDGRVEMVPYKYLLDYIDMPYLGVLLLLGVGLVLLSFYNTIIRDKNSCIITMSIGVVITVTMILVALGVNNTSFYPSTSDLQSSLTIANASSSQYTLTVMGYVSLLVPFVLAYIAYVWRLMNKEPITEDEINSEHHSY
ncbi:MAG: cytochrome d ubiquinol oxidase subunit II [Campylobacterales bacterium]